MPRDFASKNKKRTNATRFNDSKPSSVGAISMIIGILLGGILTASLGYYLFKPETEPSTVSPDSSKTTTPSAKTRYQAVPADEVEDPDFSYYDALENKTVEVDSPEPETSKKQENKRWIMQCGSFKQAQSAENLKATIALNGFEAKVKITQNESGSRWYRVVLGPYVSKRQAERERHQLERNNVNYCRIW